LVAGGGGRFAKAGAALATTKIAHDTHRIGIWNNIVP
jgi:hypothetical protein